MTDEEKVKRVNRLIHTSVDDCRVGLEYERDITVLTAALLTCGELGHASRDQHISRRIHRLFKERD